MSSSTSRSIPVLPATGYLRLFQIIGRDEVTEEEAAAAANRESGAARDTLRLPRKAIPALIPVSKATWWRGVRAGRFPAPVKLSPGVTAWRVEDIRALIENGVR